MTFLNDILGNILVGLSTNAILLIMLYIYFTKITKEIKNGVKEMPKWISQLYIEQTKLIKLQRAIEMRKDERAIK